MTQALHLANGATINEKLRSDSSAAAREAAAGRTDAEVLDRLFLAALCAAPTAAERERAKALLHEAEPAGRCQGQGRGPAPGDRRPVLGGAHEQGILVQSLRFHSTRSDDSAGPGSEATAGVGCSTLSGETSMAARTSLLLIAVMEVSGLLACACAADPPAGPSFRAEVAPILVRKCLGCHNDKKAEGGLDISTYARLRRGGTAAGDLIIEPGDPDSSYLIESVRGGAARAMPLKQPRLKAQEIAILARWVEQGARFDGPSPETTLIASLVDPLKGLPEVPVKTRRPEAVSALATHPAGKWLAAAMGARVVLFDLGTNKPAAELTGHPGPITALAFSPAGQELIAAGGRPGMFGAVTVWDLASRAKRIELRGHTDAIFGAAVSADGTILATAGYDRQILLWSLAKGAVLRTLKEHTDAVLGVSFSPDGKVLASCWADRTVKLWDWRTGRRIATLSGASGELYACDLRRRGLSRAGRRRGSIDPGLACLRGSARPGAVGASRTMGPSCGWLSRPMAKCLRPAARTAG